MASRAAMARRPTVPCRILSNGSRLAIIGLDLIVLGGMAPTTAPTRTPSPCLISAASVFGIPICRWWQPLVRSHSSSAWHRVTQFDRWSHDTRRATAGVAAAHDRRPTHVAAQVPLAPRLPFAARQTVKRRRCAAAAFRHVTLSWYLPRLAPSTRGAAVA